MNVHVKQSPARKIKHPSDDPFRKRKEAIGARDFSKMKFENESEKRDYVKRVESNPMNTLGRPAFYPPTEIKSSFGGIKEAITCSVEGCGGTCTAVDYFVCPRCHTQN